MEHYEITVLEWIENGIRFEDYPYSFEWNEFRRLFLIGSEAGPTFCPEEDYIIHLF